MNILLVYATTEGQTRKIAEFSAERLRALGHEVDLRDSRRPMHDLEMESYGAAVLAASVHQKTHQQSIADFAHARRAQLMSIPCLLISVSLAIAFENGEVEAQHYVDLLVERIGFRPGHISLVAGALKFDEYDYYMNQIVEHVVLADREDVSGDQEYTDWDTLGRELDQFADAITSESVS